MVYPWYMDIPRVSTPLDICGISMDIPCISHVYRSGRHIHGIYVVYTRHIPKIGVPDAEFIMTLTRPCRSDVGRNDSSMPKRAKRNTSVHAAQEAGIKIISQAARKTRA